MQLIAVAGVLDQTFALIVLLTVQFALLKLLNLLALPMKLLLEFLAVGALVIRNAQQHPTFHVRLAALQQILWLVDTHTSQMEALALGAQAISYAQTDLHTAQIATTCKKEVIAVTLSTYLVITANGVLDYTPAQTYVSHFALYARGDTSNKTANILTSTTTTNAHGVRETRNAPMSFSLLAQLATHK
jgi:hypothetical protein